MSILGYILVFTLIGSVISLIGGILLLLKEKFALKISHYLSAFAAGALLATAFFDLLPEAAEHMEELGISINLPFWTLLGILGFFLIERFIHHHHGHGQSREEKKSIIPLVIIGDTMHNFTDGVAIAATFLISIPLGIVTSLAVAAHEIPQEIGDFGLMLNRGVERKKVLLINFYSALAAMVGALLTYIYKDKLEGLLPVILSVTAGFFIYIALANLIPEIHNRDNQKVAFWETVMLFVGVIVIYFAISSLEGLTR
ncbi:MAG: ZIP Zinc transporter [Microgenomates group bacterium Gr01-1014_7]|nr:MAG: ZIP Zinc transporter [Microgenomates group bacterium Gr01-1014_7]